MLISEEKFAENIKKLNLAEDCLIYAEKSKGDPLATAMFGEGSKLISALLCLIEKFASQQELETETVLESMLEICRAYNGMKEGRDF